MLVHLFQYFDFDIMYISLEGTMPDECYDKIEFYHSSCSASPCTPDEHGLVKKLCGTIHDNIMKVCLITYDWIFYPMHISNIIYFLFLQSSLLYSLLLKKYIPTKYYHKKRSGSLQMLNFTYIKKNVSTF